jgi:hypothetical protein
LSTPEVPRIYEITVIGDVPDEMLATFPGVEARRDHDETTFRAMLPSRAALQSMLALIDLFELGLLRIRRVPFEPPG